MNKLTFLIIAVFWSLSSFAELSPVDHKIKIEEADQWTTVTDKTKDFVEVHFFGLPGESENSSSVSIPDVNNSLPASVYWKDRFGYQHLVILRKANAMISLVVPVSTSTEFIGADGEGSVRELSFGKAKWAKLDFSVTSAGEIKVVGTQLNGDNLIESHNWKNALRKIVAGYSIYSSVRSLKVGKHYYRRTDFRTDIPYTEVSSISRNYIDSPKIGYTELLDKTGYIKLNNIPLDFAFKFQDVSLLEHKIIVSPLSPIEVIVPIITQTMDCSGRYLKHVAYFYDEKDDYVDPPLWTFNQELECRPDEFYWARLRFTRNNTNDVSIEVVPLQGRTVLDRYVFYDNKDWKISYLKYLVEAMEKGVDLGSLVINKTIYDHFAFMGNSWKRLTIQTANFTEARMFGAQEGTGEIKKAAIIKSGYHTPISVDFTDSEQIKHRIVLRNTKVPISIIFPARDKIVWRGNDGTGNPVETKLSDGVKFVKATFKTEGMGILFVEVQELNGGNTRSIENWKSALSKIFHGESLYIGIGIDACKDNEVYLNGKCSAGTPLNCFTFNLEERKLLKYTLNCAKSESVFIPKDLKIIGANSFQGAEFTKITIPEGSLRIIEQAAFEDSKLTHLYLPDSLWEVGSSAFKNSKLETVRLSEGLSIIWMSAFENNYLKDVFIPKNVLKIHSSSFKNNKLETLSFEKDSKLTYIGQDSFYWNWIKDIKFPRGLKVIYRDAFTKGTIERVSLDCETNIIDESYGSGPYPAFDEDVVVDWQIDDLSECPSDRRNWRSTYPWYDRSQKVRGTFWQNQ